MATQKSRRPAPDPAAPHAKKSSTSGPQYRNYPPQPVGPPEVVHPLWLLKALALVVFIAFVCGYVCLCLLFYQGQWQLILHPKKTATVPASIDGMPVELLRFGMDETSRPQLTGWSVAAAPEGRYAGLTLLYLPSGDGSLADSLPTLTTLHELGVSLFAIDYRGYGQSAAIHPSQERMTQDVDWAFEYLTATRGVPAKQIVPYGVGVGASLAAHLASEHTTIPAIILDSPGPDPLSIVLSDPRTKYLPVRMLLHDRFPLAEPLTALKIPKLLLENTKDNAAYRGASNPKIAVFGLPQRTDPQYAKLVSGYLQRFLGQYLAMPMQQIGPR